MYCLSVVARFNMGTTDKSTELISLHLSRGRHVRIRENAHCNIVLW